MHDEPAGPVGLELAELPARAGHYLGRSAWHHIGQDDVDTFARLTGALQWIHLDPERAKAGPFGATIVYGYLTLALATVILDEVLTVNGAGLILNYGANRVRFPSPVPVGSRVRGAVDLASVDEINGGVQTCFRITFEVEGAEKPGCVAEILFRYYAAFPDKAPSGASQA